jgi:hypothetical protein
MHPDGIGVGVDAHQQQIHGGTAAEAVLHRLLEILSRCRPQAAAAASSLPWAAQPSWRGSRELKWYTTTFR